MAFCLVTGGAGFIGSHLVETLLAKGNRVRILDNFSSGYRHNLAQVWDQLDIVEGDIQDIAAVREAVKDVDLIFHLAALVSVPKSMDDPLIAHAINATGTLNLLTAAQKAGVHRLILSSTCAVYGDEPALPKTESMSPAPKSPYAISKLAAEMYCRVFNESFGLETVILRYFNVYGPRQDPSSAYSGVISIFVDKLRQGQIPTIFGNGKQTRDFVYVEDVVQANLLAGAVPAASGQIFNIGCGQQVSINYLFEQVRSLLRINVVANYAPARNGDIAHSYADPTLAAQILGWQPQTLLEKGLYQLLTADQKIRKN